DFRRDRRLSIIVGGDGCLECVDVELRSALVEEAGLDAAGLFGWLEPCRRNVGAPARSAPELAVQAVKQQIDYGRGVEGENLRHHQAADDGDAQWPVQLRARSDCDHERHRTE